MVQYPMKFSVQSEASEGTQSAWVTRTQSFRHDVPVAIPPEFGGPGSGLSPEDIYAMALQNCFIATFKVFAEKSRLQYELIKVESVLEVDRNEKGSPWMAHIKLHVTLSGANQEENALRILEKPRRVA